MIRILIIEDEIIIARFIEQQLLQHFSCETRIAVSLKEARTVMEPFLPQLVLCDINLEENQTGIDLIEELRLRYRFEVIYISSYQSHAIITRAAATGAANYLIKPVDEARLFAGVQLVLSRLQDSLDLGKPALPVKELLNETEYAIVQLIGQRKTTREIAALLHLSPFTVKNHRHNICHKLELENKNNALLKWVLLQDNLL